MISVNEAKQIVLSQASSLPAVRQSLQNAAGKVIAEDIYAPIDIPAYAQSSMDGYAFSFTDWNKNKSFLTIEGEMAAGSAEQFTVSPGNAARIFTGAAVPAGADTVVMQEKTKIENGQLIITDEGIAKGTNIRLKGSEIKSGELALARNSLLSPPAIGFLAGIGVTDVFIYPFPSVSIIVTGNELQTPGLPLEHGQVYESNSFSLQAALKQLQITDVKMYKAEDELDAVKQAIYDALKSSDVVFLTGGVSVGDYDFVAEAARQNDVGQLFHKIKQRPGKPFYFGKKENKLVFGLPGNPASVLTCFYEYIEPALKKMSNQPSAVQVKYAELATTFKKAAGLTHFLKGFYDGKNVTALHAQESYRLSSFAKANCLIKIDEAIMVCEAGEPVEIHLLPQ